MDEGVNLYDYTLPYRIFLCPKVDEKHGYLFLCATHAFFDGISILAAFQSISLNNNMSLLRKVAEPTLGQKLLAQVLSPIGMVRVAA
jgi:hypothetical protein